MWKSRTKMWISKTYKRVTLRVQTKEKDKDKYKYKVKEQEESKVMLDLKKYKMLSSQKLNKGENHVN